MLRKMLIYFFIDSTFGFKAIKKYISKPYRSVNRDIAFTAITTSFSTISGTALGILGLNYGTTGGIMLGSLIGTLVFPGIGTTIGAVIGGILGSITGALVGTKIGVEVGGFFGSFCAKHLIRAFSAIFNFRETNPTNPHKYKVNYQKIPIPDEAEDTKTLKNIHDIYLEKFKEKTNENSSTVSDNNEEMNAQENFDRIRKPTFFLKDTTNELVKLNFQCQNKIIKKADKKLARLYEEKKALKPLFFRVTGIRNIFWNKKQKENVQVINNKIETIKTETKNKLFLFTKDVKRIQKSPSSIPRPSPIADID